jgi:hypothetical protein
MKVKNINHDDGNTGEYIGRGSRWGNPFRIGIDGNREEVIAKYKTWITERFETQPGMKEFILEPLRGKDLVCFCAPLACHGDVLLEMLGEQDATN